MGRIFQELQRRNVLRTVAAYGVTAWLVIQIVSVVFPVLGIPDWVTTMIVVLMILGFPVCIMVSWIYDWTPRGIEVTGEDFEASETVSSGVGRQIDFVIITLLIVALGWLVYDRFPSQGPGKSIAVLPFVNLSSQKESGYFADGISEDLLNALARLPDLRVVGQLSSFSFRNDRDFTNIGKKLDVATVLDGSIQQSGKRLRITARLIDTADGHQIWSGNYDRNMKDVFAIQDEISIAIVDAMKIHLVGDVEIRLPVAEAANVEAYNLYLLARHHFKKRTVPDLELARKIFEKSIEADPRYTPSYAGLVDTLCLLSNDAFGSLPTTEVSALAMPLLHKGFRISPDLADLHASLGFLRRMERDFLAAEASLQRAIELSPNMARAHNWLYITYDGAARHKESIEVLKRAFQIDPLSPIINANLSAEHWSRGEDDEALLAANRVIEILPDSPVGYLRTARVYWTRGDLADALLVYHKALKISPDDPITRKQMGFLLLNLGRPEAAKKLLPDRKYVVDVALGNLEDALQDLSAKLLDSPDDPETILAAARGNAMAGNFSISRDLLESFSEKFASQDRSLVVRANLMFWDPAIPALDMALAFKKTGDTELADDFLVRARIHFDHLQEQELDHPGIHYQLARLYALRGEKKPALEALERAVEKGWRFGYTGNDPMLASIANTRQFGELVERIDKLVALEQEKLKTMQALETG